MVRSERHRFGSCVVATCAVLVIDPGATCAGAGGSDGSPTFSPGYFIGWYTIDGGGGWSGSESGGAFLLHGTIGQHDAGVMWSSEPTPAGSTYTVSGGYWHGVGVILPRICPGDVSADGVVDGADLGALLSEWGECEVPCDADLDGDGDVDGADLGLLLSDWGPCLLDADAET